MTESPQDDADAPDDRRDPGDADGRDADGRDARDARDDRPDDDRRDPGDGDALDARDAHDARVDRRDDDQPDRGDRDDRGAANDCDDREDGVDPTAEPTTLEEDVEAALRQVRDPEADVNVFEAGLIEEIRVNGADVTVAANLTDFEPGESDAVTGTMLRAVRSVPGVERAHMEHATPDAAGRSTGVASAERVIAVASAKGGVGKSTVAANLACALAADSPIGLFDADIHGPNAPDLLGVSGPVYSDDEGRPMPVKTDGMEVMSVGLMQEGAPLAWRGAMAHDALTELYQDTAWQDPDTVVIDLPPGTGDVVLTTLQEVRVDGVVVVTTPFHAAVTDTQRSVELFADNDVPVLGVVQNMAGFACDECGTVHDTFPGHEPAFESAGDGEVDVPVLAELPFDPALQASPSPGEVPRAFAELARRVAERVDAAWTVEAPDDAVDLRDVPPEERHDRVAEGFSARSTGEEFVLVSDRDPSPVRDYLAEMAGTDPDQLDPFEVEQATPGAWVLRTVHP